MSSLINNAMSGLNAAQAALNTASNNISSYNVAGYTRQTTIMAQANSTLGAGGWVGNGVYVSGVQREYDALTIPFQARYFATGAATPGAANADATFKVQYQ